MQIDFAIPGRVGDTELRRIGPDDPINAALVALYDDAYSVLDLGTQEKRERQEAFLRDSADEAGTVRIAAFVEGKLVGAMRWHDFTMRLRERDVFAGGLGAVAVTLDARRRGIGRQLVTAFIDAYRSRGATVALLHPFRHDFYRNLGFGHGTKMNRYRFPPGELPATGRSHRVRQVDASYADAVAACYERVRAKTNGLIVTDVSWFRRRLGDLGLRAFAFVDEDGTVRGVLFTRPFLGKAQNANAAELRVAEPIAEDPQVFLALLAFLGQLRDQFGWIVLETQDDAFSLVLGDPRDASRRILHPPAYHETNAQGAGVMYRVLDVPRALEAVGAGHAGDQTAWASLQVHDSVVAANSEKFDLALEDDAVHEGVTLTLDIAEFSSLIVGSASLRTLYDHGLATVSEARAVSALDRTFRAERPPLCTTPF